MNNREKALEFIRARQRKTTVGPTLRELASYLGVVPNAAQQHVEKFRKEGLVEKNNRRGIVLVAQAPKRTPRAELLPDVQFTPTGFEARARQPILKPSGKL